MTKLEREMKRREQHRINSINKVETDLAEDALRILWDVALIGVGVVAGMYISANRAHAATSVSIAPRCEYVGVISETAPTAPELPTPINEVVTATMPDAVMVERIGEPHEEWESLGTWLLTAYCKGSCCNGRNAGRTASGAPMVVGDTVAVGHLPFGTKLKINDHVYTVTDRGVHGHHVDILHASHQAANNFGMQHAEVWVLKQ